MLQITVGIIFVESSERALRSVLYMSPEPIGSISCSM
jgi:hypothetical protein